MRYTLLTGFLFLVVQAASAQLEWEERAPSGVLVEGRHVTNGSGESVVTYSLDGRTLSPSEVRALGIPKKDWSATVDIPSGVVGLPRKSLPPAPSPLAGLNKSSLVVIDATPTAAALAAQEAIAESDAGKGLFHTGIFTELAVPFSIQGESIHGGVWEITPDGNRVARVEISSAGAAGIRVEFAALSLPSGGYAIVYGRNDLTSFGPFTNLDDDGSSLWTPTVSGDVTTVEVVIPASASLAQVRLEVGRIVHQYIDPSSLLKANAGACNLDVTCYPAWATTALGVAGLGSIGSSGSLFCTGTLLNDEDPCTDMPYLLTARHCVGGQTAASSLEFYWQYQTPSCNGTPPSPSTVPRTTGGADYLAGSGGTGFSGGGNDFSLLLMRNDPPSGLTRAGFSSLAQPLGTQVTCVHHPRGDFKRITFGTLTDTDNTHASLYHEVTWDQGTTEPGSSGSPLMLTATQQIIGQLWGGGASCSALTDPDYYGRFDVTYPVIASIIGPARVGFAGATFSGNEGDGSVTLAVELSKPAPAGGVTVECVLSGGTALVVSDYVNATLVAEFDEGDTTATVSVALVNDMVTEPDQDFSVALQNPSACAALSSSAAAAVVTIVDDDPDTDGDGISDADELAGTLGAVTDPFLYDSDGDGLSDRQELLGTRGAATDPNVYDMDDDGINDGLEWIYGTDPLVPNLNFLSSMVIPWLRE